MSQRLRTRSQRSWLRSQQPDSEADSEVTVFRDLAKCQCTRLGRTDTTLPVPVPVPVPVVLSLLLPLLLSLSLILPLASGSGSESESEPASSRNRVVTNMAASPLSESLQSDGSPFPDVKKRISFYGGAFAVLGGCLLILYVVLAYWLNKHFNKPADAGNLFSVTGPSRSDRQDPAMSQSQAFNGNAKVHNADNSKWQNEERKANDPLPSQSTPSTPRIDRNAGYDYGMVASGGASTPILSTLVTPASPMKSPNNVKGSASVMESNDHMHPMEQQNTNHHTATGVTDHGTKKIKIRMKTGAAGRDRELKPLRIPAGKPNTVQPLSLPSASDESKH